MDKKVLITGATGFVGSHLVDYLLIYDNCEIHCIKRWRSRTENVTHFQDKVTWWECDLRDASSIRDVVEKIKPNYIFHLAAQSYVPTSWTAPTETLETNIIGELNLFEAVRKTGINTRIQIAGSSEEYGLVYQNETPIKETNPLRPLSPYGVSKVAQDMLAYQYFKSYGLNIIRTRAFNHTGPRRPNVFVCSSFARQMIQIEEGKKDELIKVGNVSAIRDFTDVRDMVRGYYLAITKGKPGEVYNICSGKGTDILGIIYLLLEKVDITVDLQKDPAKMRPSDVPVLIGDATKFTEATGWKPKIPLRQTLEDLLNYWREK